MWYLKAFLVFAFVVAVIVFGLANRGQEVYLKWWNPTGEGTPVDFVVALFGAFALGILVFFFISLFREFRLHRRCSRLAREVERLRRELDALRTAPLEGPLPDASRGQDPSEEGRSPGRSEV